MFAISTVVYIKELQRKERYYLTRYGSWDRKGDVFSREEVEKVKEKASFEYPEVTLEVEEVFLASTYSYPESNIS